MDWISQGSPLQDTTLMTHSHLHTLHQRSHLHCLGSMKMGLKIPLLRLLQMELLPLIPRCYLEVITFPFSWFSSNFVWLWTNCPWRVGIESRSNSSSHFPWRRSLVVGSDWRYHGPRTIPFQLRRETLIKSFSTEFNHPHAFLDWSWGFCCRIWIRSSSKLHPTPLPSKEKKIKLKKYRAVKYDV